MQSNICQNISKILTLAFYFQSIAFPSNNPDLAHQVNGNYLMHESARKRKFDEIYEDLPALEESNVSVELDNLEEEYAALSSNEEETRSEPLHEEWFLYIQQDIQERSDKLNIEIAKIKREIEKLEAQKKDIKEKMRKSTFSSGTSKALGKNKKSQLKKNGHTTKPTKTQSKQGETYRQSAPYPAIEHITRMPEPPLSRQERIHFQSTPWGTHEPIIYTQEQAQARLSSAPTTFKSNSVSVNPVKQGLGTHTDLS